MAKKKLLCRDKRGLFVRNLGWKRTAKGYAQQKFYLGRDEAQAEIASRKLEQLWEVVCARWKAANPPQARRKAGSSMKWLTEGSADPDTGPELLSFGGAAVLSVGVGKYVREGKPAWDEVSMTIAEAIRSGEAVARIPLPERLGQLGLTSPSVGEWLDQLRRDVPLIHIVLRDRQQQEEAEADIRNDGIRLIDEGRRKLRQQQGEETLHAALDAYRKWIRTKFVSEGGGEMTAWGNTQTRQVIFLREHLPDCQLSELTAHQIDSLLHSLSLRPVGESGKQVSVAWARNCVKQFRHFVRWLNKAPEFDWKRPSDLEFDRIKVRETADEKAAPARSARVQTYAVDELKVLWQHASPLQRTFMVLALNCGFGRAEVASLELADVYLHQEHPRNDEVGWQSTDDESWILRIRPKSGVYGEFKLWPVTVAAIDWWLEQRKHIDIKEGISTLLVSRQGKRYDTPTKGNHTNFQIPNSWITLTNQVRKKKQHSDFRKLSFNKLRKTAGNLIRVEAGGEVAGVFLCHGTPVKADSLLDAYTNRPFTKVFEAIDLVGQRLENMWSSVANPFPEQRPKQGKSGSNIEINERTIRRIQKLRHQGYKVAYIAEKLGVSWQTVSRHSSPKKPK